MHTCLVLGAGASLANAEHFHSERLIAKNPPLDFTFFQKIRELYIPVPSALRAYAEALPGPNPFRRPGRSAVPTPIRMEEFFKDLFHDFQEAGEGSQTQQAYSELVDIYVRVLRETTNWMCADSKKGGPVGQLLAAAAGDTDELTVLTFNHDLLIENEIEKRARLRNRWCLARGYGSAADDFEWTTSKLASQDTFRSHGSGCDHQHPIRVLKLHGSLNWYVRLHGRLPRANLLLGRKDPPPTVVTDRRRVSSRLRYSSPGPGRTSWYTWPVVIPPVYGKSELIRHFVRKVWIDAQETLAKADRFAVVGYSLPFLDIDAEKLFQRGIANNSHLQHIDVVNPDPGSAARWAALMGSKPVRWYKDIGVFLSTSGLA